MGDKTRKTFIIILLIFGIVFTLVGTTFAFFGAAINANGNQIGGGTYDFDVAFNVTTEKSGKLIPVADNLILSTLNSTHVCEDVRGYGLCNLYKVRFTNSGSAQSMSGYIKTSSSTYTTSNLKYQLFTLSNSTYTAISDMGVINHTTNANNNFTLSSNNVTVSLADGTSSSTITDIYLAIWISDPGSNQLEDENKTYGGTLTFTSDAGASVTATFNLGN